MCSDKIQSSLVCHREKIDSLEVGQAVKAAQHTDTRNLRRETLPLRGQVWKKAGQFRSARIAIRVDDVMTKKI